MNWRRDRSIHAGRTQASMSWNEVRLMAVKKSEPAKKSSPAKPEAKPKAAPAKAAPTKAAPKKAAPKKK